MTNPKYNSRNAVTVSIQTQSFVPLGGVEALPTIYPQKLEVMGGLCYDTLPKVCDDDWWVPVEEAWSMESTLLLTGSNWSQVMQLMLQGIPTEEGYDLKVSCELDKKKQVDMNIMEVLEGKLINCVLKPFVGFLCCVSVQYVHVIGYYDLIQCLYIADLCLSMCRIY